MSSIYDFKAATDEELGIGMPPDRAEDKNSISESNKAEDDEDEKVASAKAKAEEAEEEEEEEEEPAAKVEEDDDEEDEDEEDEESPKKGKGGKNNGVPFKRFQEVLKKNHAQEAELSNLSKRLSEMEQAQQEKVSKKQAEDDAYDFKGKEKEYARLLSEVDYEKAAELRDEINGKIAERVSKHSQAEMREEIAKLRNEQWMVQAKAELDSVAKTIWKDHPFLDHNNKKAANPEAIQELVDLRDYYIKTKQLSPGQALAAAAKMIAPQYAPKVEVSKQSRSAREVEADRRAEEASQKTPPATGKVGVGAKAEKDTGKEYTNKQWNALPEEERNRMLGIRS